MATNVGGIPEIVKNDETGFLVEPQNADSLKKALEKLIKNENLRKSMGEKGKKRVTQEFDAKKMAKAYGEIYTWEPRKNDEMQGDKELAT